MDCYNVGMDELHPQRHYGHPRVVQFSVFLENRVGQLRKFLQLLDIADIRVAAISIVDSVDCAIVRCVLCPSDTARDLLRAEKLAASETDLVIVELPSADALSNLCECLIEAEVNIHYIYAMLYRPTGQPTIALHLDEPEVGANVLRKSHFVLLGESDLK